jgi:hypothetical protein
VGVDVTQARKVSRVPRGPEDHTEIQPTAAVQLRGPARLDQLQAELELEGLALSAEGDPASASSEEPVVVWTDDPRLAPEQLSAVAKHHEPDPDWTPAGE